jgi:hypothetical protein
MRTLALAVLLQFTATHGNAQRLDTVRTFVREMLHTSGYERVDADLNGDGRKESFVYVTDPSFCGSGGCLLLVLSPRGNNYSVVMRATVVKRPIMIFRTATHGWRDVGVTVQGGGNIRTYVSRLRFDGHRYPSNPTIPPAVPLDWPSGKVLLRG